MAVSERSQIYIVWWAVIFALIYGLSVGFLMHMVPPPDATMSADAVAAFYQEHKTAIQIGAVIASWTAAFMIPFWAVLGIQISRQETGKPVWTVMAIGGGVLMSIFLVLPPLFWGVAAFTPDRAPEVTQLMHQLGVLTWITTDQIYIFNWVALIVICFLPQTAPHSPFPRWYGYLCAWIGLMFEAGAIAFLTKTGPFAWDGLLAFFSPASLFCVWIIITAWLLLPKLKAQQRDAEAASAVSPQGDVEMSTPPSTPWPA